MASELYGIERWGAGYYRVNERGHVCVRPERDRTLEADISVLVDELVERGIALPVLLRFGGILENRIEAIDEAFRTAIEKCDYAGDYQSVYPVKVNQQRLVIDELLRGAQRLGVPFGLEAGSKAELLAVLAICGNDTTIVCNGFKDDEYLEMVLLAQQVGRRVTPVVERLVELERLLALAERFNLRPRLGLRVKLATAGAGRWSKSAGYRSKFGLDVGETLQAVELLGRAGKTDCLHLLHYHLGSQITDVRQIKAAVLEVTRIYTELVRLGAFLDTLDVGGGLGVDYDGSRSGGPSSINYELQEYADNVVGAVKAVCMEAGVEAPTIVSECGRALTAHHSVLVFDVLGVDVRSELPIPDTCPPGASRPLVELYDAWQRMEANASADALAAYHDAQQALEDILELFRLGHLTIEERALAESLYWQVSVASVRVAAEVDLPSVDLGLLRELTARVYFCNFSLFQSIPDSWAIDQLFPIMPIGWLLKEPKVRAVLADVTCDSDGTVDRFIDSSGVAAPTLLLHDPDPAGDGFAIPYRLGAFLVGAYQEILGDLHNLFGDTNVVHVRVDRDQGPVIEDVVAGERVREMLSYVQFDAPELLRGFRRDVEAAVRQDRLSIAESGRLLRFFEDGLEGYTYLE